MDMTMLSLVGIFISVAIYIWLIFVGLNVWILSVLASVIVCLFSGADAMKMLMGPYMTSFVGFARSFFLLFVASAIFGRFIADSGVAYSLGQHLANLARRGGKHKLLLAALCLPVINATLTYAGVSLFVVVFTLMFIARDLFKELDVPWHFYGMGVFGTATFSMSMLPGSPQIANLLPIKYFGTNPMAAPVLGTVMAVIMIVMGIGYCQYQVVKAKKNDEHYIDTAKNLEAHLAASGTAATVSARALHPVWKCLLPLPVPIIAMNVFKMQAPLALMIAVAVTYVLFRAEFKSVKDVIKALNEGAINGFTPVLSVCAATGFGGVVAAMPGFKILVSGLTAMPGPAELQMVVAIALASGIVGSASAGQTIALDALAKHYAPLIDSQVAHRLAATASFGSFMPHNGAIFSSLSIVRVSHKDIFKHYFWLGGVIPGIVTMIGIVLSKMGIR